MLAGDLGTQTQWSDQAAPFTLVSRQHYLVALALEPTRDIMVSANGPYQSLIGIILLLEQPSVFWMCVPVCFSGQRPFTLGFTALLDCAIQTWSSSCTSHQLSTLIWLCMSYRKHKNTHQTPCIDVCLLVVSNTKFGGIRSQCTGE